MKQPITLEYGQRVMFPTYPVMPIPIFGIGLQSRNGEPVMVEMEIKKYWEKDTDANQYKVALHPVDISKPFGIEKLYSSDLKLMIQDGTVQMIEK